MAHEHLLRICAQLKQQGKQPSVGLVKAKAGSAFQLAAIISAVQFFKDNPDWQPPQQETVAPQAPQTPSNQSHAQLQARVDTLEKQVMALEKNLKALQKQLSEN